jgi:hypothetical protein
MNLFNRIVAILLWLTLLACALFAATLPLASANWLQTQAAALVHQLEQWQAANPTNFLIGQAAAGIGSLLLFGTLLFFEVMSGRQRGVRIRTTEGGSAELDPSSVGRRLQWHLDQLAEVITVIPAVKSRGGAVDIRLEIETAPDIDIPMKTDEVVDVTREVIERDMGLKLGKLDVRIRCAPFVPEWNN